MNIARLMKHVIEEKEFFLYPHKPAHEIFDIMLHKSIWFYDYFLDFVNGDHFFEASTTYKKSLIYNQYREIQDKHKFKKISFYKIIVVENHSLIDASNDLQELFDWLTKKGINIHLIFVHLPTLTTQSIFSNFEDKQHIQHFIHTSINTMENEEFTSMDLIEIEQNTRHRKGYYLENNKNYMTKLILCINIFVFIYMSIKGNTTSIYDLIAFGAKYNPLIAAGQYYRLISNMFIHIGLIHLLFNTYALKMLGKDVETIYGWKKFTIIYLIAGIFGSLGSFLFSSAVSAGASGAIFGLMGAYLYFGMRRPTIFSARYGMNLITLLLINIVFGLTNSNIDNFAHIGGLIGGYLASWSLGLKDEKILQGKRIIMQLSIMIIIMVLLFTGVHIHQQSWEYHLHKGLLYLEAEDIKDAQIQFEKGLKKNANISHFYFYLAYIHYKEGHSTRAIDLLEQALILDPDDTMSKNLLRDIQNE
ncbi:rhomboid family intramembrane serine protease [Clostridiaceae bacterium 35-E11]